MGNIKNRDFLDYGEDAPMLDDDALPEIESDVNDEGSIIDLDADVSYRRTWRDTEKYKEMRELHKIINDDLYTGYLDDGSLEDSGYD